ncbi:MAG: hypothetical protein OEQ28_14020, partial [Acidobacteriota bacterium]|nr:hypothetical protein [Acidobacteriota bacterium]
MMSKNKKSIFALIMALLLHIGAVAGPEPGRLDVVITIGENGKRCVVEGKYSGEGAGGQRNLSFVDSYADADGLAKRVLNPTATGRDGRPLQLRKFSAGEYVASGPIYGFNYQFELPPPEPLIAAPHVSWYASAINSWTDGERALLKLGDILPEAKAAVVGVKFLVPKGWSIAT